MRQLTRKRQVMRRQHRVARLRAWKWSREIQTTLLNQGPVCRRALKWKIHKIRGIHLIWLNLWTSSNSLPRWTSSKLKNSLKKPKSWLSQCFKITGVGPRPEDQSTSRQLLLIRFNKRSKNPNSQCLLAKLRLFCRRITHRRNRSQTWTHSSDSSSNP